MDGPISLEAWVHNFKYDGGAFECKKMIKSVQKTIVLADASKFGKKGFGRNLGRGGVPPSKLRRCDQINHEIKRWLPSSIITTLEGKKGELKVGY